MKLRELENEISRLMSEFEESSGLRIVDTEFFEGHDEIVKHESMSMEVTKYKGEKHSPRIKLTVKSR